MRFSSFYGVDFSGARLAGENIWIARIIPRSRGFELVELSRLRQLCGTAERDAALAYLVELIRSSERALWGLDFPFGLPIEVVDAGATWADQVRMVGGWKGDAYDLGTECVRRARARGGAMHIRRITDVEARTPFDCYHYRIIYQTFHGMRDVLGPLMRAAGTAILPFQYGKLRTAKRCVVEACPGSTLKRLGLPHNNYKQPQGGSLTRKRLRTRREIVDGLHRHVLIPPDRHRIMMRDAGADALDAVIAAIGTAQGWSNADHSHIASHRRYVREGRLYV